ncbi:hypothetical protein CYY_005777 [Polysphondylium violaceum]|uniref:Uncharacterized protein n=1 Tax=Polysphondylium violaceum TaxID=133409 RepID=A0A8J4PTQ4_9MYCE|nr:hypothetical protein CYY_005777 [Polysphondylium violaceum]
MKYLFISILIICLCSTSLVYCQSSSSSSSSSDAIDGVHYLVGLTSNGTKHIGLEYNFTSEYSRASVLPLKSKILGVLQCMSNSLTFVHIDTSGNFVKSSLDYTHFNVTDLATIYIGADNYQVSSQYFGYDISTDTGFLPVIANNGALFVWRLNFQQLSTTLVPFSNIIKKGTNIFPPVGAYDPSSGRYYLLYSSNNVYNLGIYNFNTGSTSSNTVFNLDSSFPAQLLVIESKVYALINKGSDIYLYQIDPVKNIAKEVIYFDNSQTSISKYNGVQYAVNGNRILLLTNFDKAANTITYVVFDPATGLLDQFIGNDQVGAYDAVFQVCVN